MIWWEEKENSKNEVVRRGRDIECKSRGRRRIRDLRGFAWWDGEVGRLGGCWWVRLVGWCWRRCLSEEGVDGGDDIGYYPLCWVFFCYFLGGLFFSRLSGDGGGGDDDEWETYMSTRNGIFSFPSYIYLVQRIDFFFLHSHPRSYL